MGLSSDCHGEIGDHAQRAQCSGIAQASHACDPDSTPGVRTYTESFFSLLWLLSSVSPTCQRLRPTLEVRLAFCEAISQVTSGKVLSSSASFHLRLRVFRNLWQQQEPMESVWVARIGKFGGARMGILTHSSRFVGLVSTPLDHSGKLSLNEGPLFLPPALPPFDGWPYSKAFLSLALSQPLAPLSPPRHALPSRNLSRRFLFLLNHHALCKLWFNAPFPGYPLYSLSAIAACPCTLLRSL